MRWRFALWLYRRRRPFRWATSTVTWGFEIKKRLQLTELITYIFDSCRAKKAQICESISLLGSLEKQSAKLKMQISQKLRVEPEMLHDLDTDRTCLLEQSGILFFWRWDSMSESGSCFSFIYLTLSTHSLMFYSFCWNNTIANRRSVFPILTHSNSFSYIYTWLSVKREAEEASIIFNWS